MIAFAAVLYVKQLVALLECHRPKAVRAHLIEVFERRLLHFTPPGGEHQEIAVFEVGRSQDGSDRLARLDVDHVDQRRAACRAVVARHLPRLELVDLALVAEEQDVVACVRGNHVPQSVFFAQHLADDPATAPPLDTVRVGRHALHVAAAADRDQHLLVGDKILVGDLAGEVGHDLRASRVAKLLLQLGELVAHEIGDLARVGQQVLEIGDALFDLLVLLQDALALEVGQLAELHLQDGPRLRLAQRKTAHQHRPRGVAAGGFADGADHRVEVVQRDDQTFEDVGALASLAQLELRPSRQHLLAVVEELDKQALQWQ